MKTRKGHNTRLGMFSLTAAVLATVLQTYCTPVEAALPAAQNVAVMTVTEKHDWGIALGREAKYDQALPLLEQAANITQHPKYVSDYITVLRWAGRNDLALSVFQKWQATHTEPLSSYAQKALGDIYVARGNANVASGMYVKAAEDYDKAAKLVPSGDKAGELRVVQNRATAFVRAGEFAETRDVLYPYIQNGTATINMQSDYITALQGTTNWQRATTEGERLWPDKSKVPAYGLQALADSYMRLKKYKPAIAYHTELINRKDKELKYRPFLSRGYAYLMTGEIKEGIADYKAAIEERPACRFLVCEDAKGLMARGRYHLAKRLFSLLTSYDTMVQTKDQAAGGSDASVYRQQYAYDLKVYGMPREAYREYKKLAEDTQFKETAYAGMAQTALDFGDYQEARDALKQLNKYDTGSKEAEVARKAWDNRWHGSLVAQTSLFENYQNKDYRDGGIEMENELGGSWRLLSGWDYRKRDQDNADYSDTGFSAGLRYVGRNFDVRLSANTTMPSGLGYTFSGSYYFQDFTWLNYAEQRSGVDNPAGYSADVLHTSRELTLHRQIGPKDLYSIGYLWDHYSDSNKAHGFNWRFSHMSVRNNLKQVEWYLFQRHYSWDKESPYYDSPSSRIAYGPGLRQWWDMPRKGYWEWIVEPSFGYDEPDNTDFTPYTRLERGWYLAPGRTLAVGFEYGWRSDRTNDTRRLGRGYHQFDVRYNWNW